MNLKIIPLALLESVGENAQFIIKKSSSFDELFFYGRIEWTRTICKDFKTLDKLGIFGAFKEKLNSH